MWELEWVSNRLVTNQPQIDQVAEVRDVLPVDEACDGKNRGRLPIVDSKGKQHETG